MAIFRAVNNERKCLNKCSENVQVFSFLSENVIDALGSKDHVHFFLQIENILYIIFRLANTSLLQVY